MRDKATEESKKKNQRAPTTAEQDAIRLLLDVLQELAPDIMAVFNRGTTSYTVARTEVVLGQLKSGRSYRSREVFLAESVLVSDFPEAMATFLHEHAHIFGYDGSRGFSDALTALLETIVRHRQDLDQFEVRWEKARMSISREREAQKTQEESSDLDDWLSVLNENDLRALIAKVPPVLLKKLRKHSPDANSD